MQLRECIRMFDVQSLHAGLEEYALLSTFRSHHFRRVELRELPSLEWRCIPPPSFPPSLPLPTVMCTWLLPLRPQWLSCCPSSPSSHRVQTDYDGPVGHQHQGRWPGRSCPQLRGWLSLLSNYSMVRITTIPTRRPSSLPHQLRQVTLSVKVQRP